MFDKIKSFYKKIIELIQMCDKHNVFHIIIGCLVPIIFVLIGCNVVLSMIFGCIFGLAYEFAYCYIPIKTCKTIFGIKIKIFDIKSWRTELSDGEFIKRHDFANENYKYNFLGIFISVILLIMIKFI